jgi:hypothetical protein
MRPAGKALLLAGLHLAIAGSLGVKLLVDRATRPRVWLKAAPVDPDLPIRGRYVSLRLEVPVRGAVLGPPQAAPGGTNGAPPAPRPHWPQQPWPQRYWLQVRLEPQDHGLVAVAQTAPGPAGNPWSPPAAAPGLVRASLGEDLRGLPQAQWFVRLEEPVPFFIPETIPDPSRRPAGEELWAEVTVPRKGPLRPIRLGVKRNGVFRLLETEAH